MTIKPCKYILLCFVALLTQTASTTPQTKDRLLYNGFNTKLVVCGSYDYRPARDFFLERYFHQNKIELKEPLGYGSTACYRGYIATWELKEGKLYLNKLEEESWSEPGSSISLTNVFPKATNEVFANWVTAEIRIPQGKELPFHNEGNGSNYEKDLYVNLTNGVIESSIEISNLGKRALLSTEHMKWVMSANKPLDQGRSSNWDDLREVATSKYYLKELRSKYPLKTRGFLRVHDENLILYVDDTRLTPYVSFWLNNVPADFKATNGVPVEIKATFSNTEKYEEEFDVKSIRYLKPGEAVHHPYYKLKLREISPLWTGTLFEE